MRRPHFIPEDTAGSRQETAVLLVGTAREFGISQRSILSASLGFFVSDELADVLYAEDDEVSGNPEPEPEPAPVPTPKKTSGNRAAKNNSTEEE